MSAYRSNPILRIMKRTGNTVARPAVAPAASACAVEGCAEAAGYPAPRSREALSQYVWLCLKHVRAYNTAWDFYAGMNEAEIEAHRRADTTWRRPTWPFGTRRADTGGRIHDRLGIVDRDGAREAAPSARLCTAKREALATLGLSPPASAASVKARYKELVKALHPDANGRDDRAEERLKSVNQAYNTLRASRTL